jgi:ribonuclease HI
LKNGIGASGEILRNSTGVIAAASMFILHVASANMVEAVAMLHALSLANRLGNNDIEAESNSLKVINLCSGASESGVTQWQFMQTFWCKLEESGK